MNEKKHILHWRTAPRSVSVLLSWLPFFYAHQDQDYNETTANLYPEYSPHNKNLHPVRRAIAYEYEQAIVANPDTFVDASKEQFLKGYQPGDNPKKDRADKESRVRQVVTTAEQMGFMNSKNAHLTKVGEKVVKDTFTGDDLIKQLLKLFIVANPGDEGVFPFKTFIKLLDKYKYLSRNELTFIFGVINDSDFYKANNAVHDFRENYNALPNKNKDFEVKQILKKVWNKYFLPVTDQKLYKTLRKDYTDAFSRFLVFTGLFFLHGRGLASKLRVTKLYTEKFNLLIDQSPFSKPPLNDKKIQLSSRDSIYWFGDTDNIVLPWENKISLTKMVISEVDMARNRLKNIPNPSISTAEFNNWLDNLKQKKYQISELNHIEHKVFNAMLVVNKEEFVQKTSQTKEVRKQILERYDLINSNADESALWLEVNTWKAFVALKGHNKTVKPNFVMNPDLTPRSFAPGTGNTPDMEVYFDNSAIIPEVSLMTGVQQWEHEGSSVIDHVLEKIKENPNQKILGLFISKAINIRTNWQFFLLNRESWMGKPVPVVPMKLNSFVSILEYLYKKNLGIFEFNNLLTELSNITKQLSDFHDWDAASEQIIEQWRECNGRIQQTQNA